MYACISFSDTIFTEMINMPVSDAKLKANKKYRKKFKYLQARVSEEEKMAICNHAKTMSESLNTFIRRAIAETMERDKKKHITE